jgi:hypothetical protein
MAADQPQRVPRRPIIEERGERVNASDSGELFDLRMNIESQKPLS